MGGIRPFTEGDVANYMNMPQQSIKKGIIRMKRKKLIEPIGFGLYVISESGLENEMTKIKQEKVLTLIRGTGKSLF